MPLNCEKCGSTHLSTWPCKPKSISNQEISEIAKKAANEIWRRVPRRDIASSCSEETVSDIIQSAIDASHHQPQEWSVIEAETRGEDGNGPDYPLYHIWTGNETMPLYHREKEDVQDICNRHNSSLVPQQPDTNDKERTGGDFYNGIEWLACWLIDHAEKETITEEQLRPWAAAAWKDHLSAMAASKTK